MPDPLLYCKAMGIAAAASAIVVIVLLSLRRLATKSVPNQTWCNAASVVGISVGLWIGYAMLALNLSWPPRNGLDRFLLIMIPAVLGVELIAGVNRVPQLVAWVFRISLSIATPRILLHDSVYLSNSGDWTSWRSNATIVVCGLGLAFVWSLLCWLSKRSGGLSLSFSLCLALQCSGIVVMLAGYVKGGAAAIPLVAVLLGVTLAQRLATKNAAKAIRIDRGDGFVAAGVIGVGVVSLFSLLFIGRFFGEISTGPALAMLLAPLLCWTTELPLIKNRKPWFIASVRITLVAILLLVVLFAAKQAFDREMAPLLGRSLGQHRNYF
ncbi:MAG: hypothetical protein WBD20_16765 [Pirellulaceae bacterium]